MTFANSLEPDLARQNVGPDLDLNCLTRWYSLIEIFENVNFEDKDSDNKKRAK